MRISLKLDFVAIKEALLAASIDLLATANRRWKMKKNKMFNMKSTKDRWIGLRTLRGHPK